MWTVREVLTEKVTPEGRDRAGVLEGIQAEGPIMISSQQLGMAGCDIRGQ